MLSIHVVNVFILISIPLVQMGQSGVIVSSVSSVDLLGRYYYVFFIFNFFILPLFSPQFRYIPVRARERLRLKVMRPPIHNPTSRTAS